jgi:hypothetical protein
VITPAPPGVHLADVAARVAYVGSPEHKSHPSFAGPPLLRSDASKCDPTLADQEELHAWLALAITSGQVGGPWEGGFPRYAWLRRGERCYEGRLVNRELGQYKGYPLRPEEWPEGVR